MGRESLAFMLHCSYARIATLPRHLPGSQSLFAKSREQDVYLVYGSPRGTARLQVALGGIIKSSVSDWGLDLLEKISTIQRAVGQFVRIPFM